MTVLRWGETPAGNVTGRVAWASAPGAVFDLVITREGLLIEWCARADDGRSLSARQLRSAPVGAMERAIRREVASTSDVMRDYSRLMLDLGARFGIDVDRTDAAESASWARSLADFAERPRTGPSGRSDRSYATLAALYVRLVEEGEQRPIHAVADRLGLAKKTVQNHLFKARERGLLTSAGRGRAGGRLTDKAKEMLSGDDQAP